MDAKVFIWGTGVISKYILEHVEEEGIYSFVESNPKQNMFRGKGVIRPQEIKMSERDLLIVAVENSSSIEKMIESLDNIIEERTVFICVTMLKDKIKWAAQYVILSDAFNDEAVRWLALSYQIDSFFYNPDFLKFICRKEKLTFPSDKFNPDGYMKPYFDDVEIMNSRFGNLLRICFEI